MQNLNPCCCREWCDSILVVGSRVLNPLYPELDSLPMMIERVGRQLAETESDEGAVGNISIYKIFEVRQNIFRGGTYE
jgi:hypothetical protein